MCAARAALRCPPCRSGLASALGGRLGIVTASNSGAIKHLPVAELRRAAQDQGVAVLSELASADWNQVRGRRGCQHWAAQHAL